MKKKFLLSFSLILNLLICVFILSQEEPTKEVKKEEIKIRAFKDLKEFLSEKPEWFEEVKTKPITPESPAERWKDIKSLESTGITIKEMIKYCFQYLETYNEPTEENKLVQKDALMEIANNYFLLEDYPKAVETNTLILKLFQEPLELILKARYNIAESYVRLGEKEKALKILKESIPLLPEPKIKILPEVEMHISAIKDLIDMLENPPKMTLEDFLKDTPDWIKKEDLTVSNALDSDTMFATIIQAKRENKSAEEIITLCYLHLKAFPKSNFLRTVQILLNLGDAFNSLNDYKRAGNAYQLVGVLYPKWEYGVVLSYDKLGQNYLDQKKPEEAIKVWDECLAKYGNTTGAAMNIVKEMKLRLRDLKEEIKKATGESKNQ